MTWKDQLANSITTPEQLAEHFDIDPEPLRTVVERYPLAITPHYLQLIKKPNDPFWKQAVPDPAELLPDALPEDSMNEAAFAPVPAIVHRYPDRALLLVSGRCAGYCRFCTRKSRVGKAQFRFTDELVSEGLEYISRTTAIRDVILTGGDPLLLDDAALAGIMERLQRIQHLDIVRIGSRVPVTLPARVTAELCAMLSEHAPLYLNTHFNHPLELTAESIEACQRLADSGVVLGNQAVLLRGVNDDASTMIELGRRLLKARVRPYYLHHLDQAKGTGHFRVPVERGLEILKMMRGKISGLGIPQYVVDPPGGEGKVVLYSENILQLGRTCSVRTAAGVVEMPNRD